ncbi:MAG: type II toxin-antitoxin system VapC family toxin [candidate division NC10 bacterium]|nr:type II toxin-antitoxin system VapC family toxin [candidate division NC10 bacterium]
MTDYCLDASALVKRYADEPGSAWVRQITDPAAQHTILLAEITLAEVAAALAAKQRIPGGLTLEEWDRALSRFLQDCDEHFLLLPVDRGVIDQAVGLTQRYRLRGYDAVQLATALVTSEELTSHALPPLVFVASDDDLLTAAKVEGLSTENPLHHADLDARPPAVS